MKADIKVPSMGESINEATVGTILKPSGSKVMMDDEVIELETEKVNQVLYASQTGVLNLSVSKGDVVKIGQVIGSIDTEGKAVQEAPKSIPKEEIKKKPAQKEEKPQAEGARVSRERYIEQLQEEKKPEKPVQEAAKPIISTRETRQKMSKIRQVIARRLVESQQTTAMLTTFNEIDMSQVISARERYKEAFTKQHGVRLGFMSFFVKAAVVALQEYQGLNSYIDGDEIVHREYYDIGIAVGTDRGLVVPVVRGCDHLTFAQIESAIEVYGKKAKEGGLSLDDLQGGGFTITNGGVYGSLLSTPILNPPQSGILGMHKIQKRAVVVEDQIVIKPMMYVALSYDHRIVDGKEAVSFLVTIKNFLEDPTRLVLNI